MSEVFQQTPAGKRRDEAEKVSIVQQIMLRSTEYLRRIIEPVGGQRGVTMSYLCPYCNSFPLEDYIWWVSGRTHTNWWCANCGEKHDWKQPNRLLAVQTGDRIEQAKAVKAHAVPQGPLCKFDQCVEAVGESARRWRWPLTEYGVGAGKGEQKRSYERLA